jgi:hypothetical protein
VTLYEIFEKVKAENARSKEKYGLWKDRPSHEQYAAILGEFEEWEYAHIEGDVDGPHGEVIEALQTINTLCRRIQFLTGEADA